MLAVLLVSVPDLQSGPLEPGLIQPEQGLAFFVDLAPLGFQLTDKPDPSSSLVMFEDGKPLVGQQLHAAIRKRGGGRFSHWGRYLHFSSSDGSDPRTNGRAYSFRVPRELATMLGLSFDPTALILALGLLLLVALHVQWLVRTAARSLKSRYHPLPLAVAVAVVAVVGALLAGNALDVTQLWVRGA